MLTLVFARVIVWIVNTRRSHTTVYIYIPRTFPHFHPFLRYHQASQTAAPFPPPPCCAVEGTYEILLNLRSIYIRTTFFCACCEQRFAAIHGWLTTTLSAQPHVYDACVLSLSLCSTKCMLCVSPALRCTAGKDYLSTMRHSEKSTTNERDRLLVPNQRSTSVVTAHNSRTSARDCQCREISCVRRNLRIDLL